MGWELVKDNENVKCWIDLDEIEIYTEGKYKGCRNWKNSIGKKFGARYKWKNDEIEEKWFIIKEYVNPCFTLVDENNNEFKIRMSSLYEGSLGKIFDKVTDKFKHDIGKTINDLVIINREYRKDKKNQNIKYYQYQCKKCENIDWISEGNLKRGCGCNVCCPSPQKIIKGINDITTTNPEFIKYFVNEDDIYKYTVSSNKKALMHCPNCGYQKEMSLNKLTQYGFSCPNCSDGISYPEKFMANVLSQLNIKFITQLNRTTFNWCQNFRYDFYLPDDDRILETNGKQHYEDEEVQKNDSNKRNVAVLNVSDYIVIDCRHSTIEWMKENIIKELGHLYDLSNIDWKKADLESQKSHMILACKFKKENQKLTTKEIVELIKEEMGIEYCNSTITNWLNRGNELGLCYYNGKEENLRANTDKHFTEETRAKLSEIKKGKNHPKATLVDRFDIDGHYVDTHYGFEYVQLGFSSGRISSCCKGRNKTHKGYVFKYHEE